MLKVAYYLLFYKLFCFFKATAEEGWEHWKALIALCVLEIWFIGSLWIWWTVIFKQVFNIDNPYWLAVPVSLFVTVSNYFIFLHKNRWKEYARDFAKYPKSKNRLTSWLAFLFVLLVLVNAVFAFYCLFLIDWKQYR